MLKRPVLSLHCQVMPPTPFILQRCSLFQKPSLIPSAHRIKSKFITLFKPAQFSPSPAPNLFCTDSPARTLDSLYPTSYVYPPPVAHAVIQARNCLSSPVLCMNPTARDQVQQKPLLWAAVDFSCENPLQHALFPHLILSSRHLL